MKNTQAEQEQQQKQKAGSRWQSRKTLDSPSSMNTQKIQQYIGQHIECYIENIECITYMLYVTYRAIYTAIHRTSWRWSEQFYNQGYKENTTLRQVGGKEKWSSQNLQDWCVCSKDWCVMHQKESHINAKMYHAHGLEELMLKWPYYPRQCADSM